MALARLFSIGRNALPASLQTKSFAKWSTPENPVALNNIADNPGARKKKTRVGRGPGSGVGKSAGRGMCGQRQREGGRRSAIFEGGQMPITRIIPKFGFKNPMNKKPTLLNLHTLALGISRGILDPSLPIDIATIHKSKVCGRVKHGLKLLSDGAEDFNIRGLTLFVSQVSKKAKETIENLGGTVKTVYYNELGLRAHLYPQKFDRLPRNAAPPPKLAGRYDIPQPFPAAPPRKFQEKSSKNEKEL